MESISQYVKDAVVLRKSFGKSVIIRFPYLGQYCSIFDVELDEYVGLETNVNEVILSKYYDGYISSMSDQGSLWSGESVSSNIDIDYGIIQADSFIKLLVTIYETDPKSMDVLFPVIHALSLLPEYVWTKFTLNDKLLSIFVHLLDLKVSTHMCSDAVGDIILRYIRSTTFNATDRMMRKLLDLWELTSEFSDVGWEILSSSIQSTISGRILDSVNKKVITSIAAGYEGNSDAWRDAITLGDEMEVFIGWAWTKATVVRINTSTDDVTFEYLSFNNSIELITMKRSSESLRSSQSKHTPIPTRSNMSISSYVSTSITASENDIVSFFLSHPLSKQSGILVSTCQAGHALQLRCLDSTGSFKCGICSAIYWDNCAHFICHSCNYQVCKICRGTASVLKAEKLLDDTVDFDGILSRCPCFSTNFRDWYSNEIRNAMMLNIHVEDAFLEGFQGSYRFKCWRWMSDSNVRYPVFENTLESFVDTSIVMTCTRDDALMKYRWIVGRTPRNRSFGRDMEVEEIFFSYSDCGIRPDDNSNWKLTDTSRVIVNDALNVSVLYQSSEKLIIKVIILLFEKLRELLIRTWSADCSDDIIDNYHATRLDMFLALNMHVELNQEAVDCDNNDSSASYFTCLMNLGTDQSSVPEDVVDKRSFEVQIASTLLEFVCRETLLILSEYAENPSNSITPIVQECIIFIIAMVNTKQGLSIVPLFIYRPLLVKYSIIINHRIKSKIFSCHQSNLDSALDLIIVSFHDIDAVRKAYKSIVQKCTSRNQIHQQYLLDQIDLITNQGGYSYLADEIIRMCLSSTSSSSKPLSSVPVSDEADRSCNLNLSVILQTHFLSSESRMSKSYMNTRKLIRFLSKYASADSLTALQSIWKGTIVTWLIRKIQDLFQSTNISTDCSKPTSIETVVKRLYCMLEKIRSVSLIEMPMIDCSENYIEALFEYTIRRLPDSYGLSLTKMIAIYASNLLDSSKHDCFQRGWQESIDMTIKLIQVLYSNVSIEFQHFYELLLAKRLLSDNYFNVNMEYHILQQLPAMTRCYAMIGDVRSSNLTMMKFRRYILDHNYYQRSFDDEIISFISSGEQNVSIHCLAAESWPCTILSPTVHAGLKLPKLLSSIQDYYCRFFHTPRYPVSRSLEDIDGKPPTHCDFHSVTIKIKKLSVDDIFDVIPSSQHSSSYGYSSRSKVRSNISTFSMKYDRDMKAWELIKAICESDNFVKYVVIARCVVDKYIPLHLMTTMNWIMVENVWNSSIQRYDQLVNSNRPCTVSVQSYRSNEPRKRLVWCHGAGIVDLICHLPNGEKRYLQVSDGQASILCQFSGSRDPHDCLLSVNDLSELVNLTESEVMNLCLSLCSHVPILQMSPSKQFRLSDHVLSSSVLTGEEEDKPIILYSYVIANSSEVAKIAANDFRSLIAWRNEIVDAAIVRYLKDISKNKLGDLSITSKNLGASTISSVDKLVESVKLSIAHFHSNVANEDIIRRAEYLVGSGVIERVHSSCIGFRSVGFCYLSDDSYFKRLHDRNAVVSGNINGSENVSKSTHPYRDSINLDREQLSRGSLFDRLCWVLLIPDPLYIEISKSLFHSRFMQWLTRASLSVDLSEFASLSSSAHLSRVVLQVLQLFNLQLRSLRSQYRNGSSYTKREEIIQRVDDDKTDYLEDLSVALFNGVRKLYSVLVPHSKNSNRYPRTNKLSPGKSSPGRDFVRYDAVGDSCLRNLTDQIHIIFFKHLPIELIRVFMKKFQLLFRTDQSQSIGHKKDSQVATSSVATDVSDDVNEFIDANEFLSNERCQLLTEFECMLKENAVVTLSHDELYRVVNKDVADSIILAATGDVEWPSGSLQNLPYDYQVVLPVPRDEKDRQSVHRSLSSSDARLGRRVADVHEIVSEWPRPTQTIATRYERERSSTLPDLLQPYPFSEMFSRMETMSRSVFFGGYERSASEARIDSTERSTAASDGYGSIAEARESDHLSAITNFSLQASNSFRGSRHSISEAMRSPLSLFVENRLSDRVNSTGRVLSTAPDDADDSIGDDDDDDDDDDSNAPSNSDTDESRRDNERQLLRLTDDYRDDENLFMRLHNIAVNIPGAPINSPASPGTFQDGYCRNGTGLRDWTNLAQAKTASKTDECSNRHVDVSLVTILCGYFSVAEPQLSDVIPDNMSSVSMSLFLHSFFFTGMCSSISMLLGLSHQYVANIGSVNDAANVDLRKKTPRADNIGQVEDVTYLPCEFCSETIPLHHFQLHQSACQRGERVSLPPPRANDSNKSTEETMRLSPPMDGAFVFSLQQSLLNLIASEAIAEFKETSLKEDFNPIERLLSMTFDAVDEEHAGKISRKSFTNDDNVAGISVDSDLFIDVNLIDPLKLYGHEKTDVPAVDHAVDFENAEASVASDPFIKVDSQWLLVNNDSSMPSLDPHRSVFGVEGISLEMQNILRISSEVMRESIPSTLAMLVHYDWDVKTMIANYLDNPSLTRASAGLGHRLTPTFLRSDLYSSGRFTFKPSNVATPSSEKWSMEVEPSVIECGICFTEKPAIEVFALSKCCHWFCRECWSCYLTTAHDSRDVKLLKCPSQKCRSVVTIDMFRYFCDLKVYGGVKEYLVRSFVEGRNQNRGKATYCKNPRGCDGIILLDDDADIGGAVCSFCSFSFCSSCELPRHVPATCELLTKWEEQEGYLETGTEEEILARQCKMKTTKPCPKCSVRIEKNGGCPHITCKFCKNQFCWECGGEFHTTTSCTRPKLSSDANPVFEFEEANRDCIHYFSLQKTALDHMNAALKTLKRPRNHRRRDREQSCSDATDRLFAFNSDMAVMNDAEASFLRLKIDAWRLIAEAQGALAYSCIVKYFVKTDSVKLRFTAQNALTQMVHNKFMDLETRRIVDWMALCPGAHVNPGSNAPLLSGRGNFHPDQEYKSALRILKRKLREYLIAIRIEIFQDPNEKTAGADERSPSRAGSVSQSVNTSPRRKHNLSGESTSVGLDLHGNASPEYLRKTIRTFPVPPQETIDVGISWAEAVAATKFGRVGNY